MIRRLAIAFGVCSMMLLVSACPAAIRQEPCPKPKPRVPEWIEALPKEEGMIYEVGASGPAYFIEDAKKTAADNCRAKLASTIATEIGSESLDSSNGSKTKVTTTIAARSQAIVRESEVVTYWLDGKGNAGKKKTTYALCRISMSKVNLK